MSDLIERQRILKKVSDIDEINKRMVVNYNDPKVLIVNSVIKQMQKIMIGMIENAPTIEPEQKKWKWISHYVGIDEDDYGWDCSECGEWFVMDEPYHYCPKCGAKMQ